MCMWMYDYQERIELPEAARDHATLHMHTAKFEQGGCIVVSV